MSTQPKRMPVPAWSLCVPCKPEKLYHTNQGTRKDRVGQAYAGLVTKLLTPAYMPSTAQTGAMFIHIDHIAIHQRDQVHATGKTNSKAEEPTSVAETIARQPAP